MNPSYEPIYNAAMTGVSRRVLLLAQGHETFGFPPSAIDEPGSIFADARREVPFVGGSVRDAFLGLPIHDFDLMTSAPPGVTERLLSSWGATTWDVGREFGTIGSVRDDVTAEVTTYRLDSHEVGPRKSRVDLDRTLEDDLFRHDFTVNAMAVRLPEFELADLCGGLDDLVDGVLRTPVTAVQLFDDDPLRIMYTAHFVV